jgi:uncharacterized protein (TIGR03437 family)
MLELDVAGASDLTSDLVSRDSITNRSGVPRLASAFLDMSAFPMPTAVTLVRRSSAPLLALAVCIVGASQVRRPALLYSKTFGGSGIDVAAAAVTDATGNIYVAGYTSSIDFPIQGGLQTRLGGVPLRISTDGGKTWSTADIAPGVTALASPGQANRLYAATSNGVYTSTDSGKTWSPMATAPRIPTSTVITDPRISSIIYAATEQGLIRSSDGGLTWAGLGTGLPSAPIAAPNLYAHPTRQTTLFASMNYSLYRSQDAGDNWSRLDGLPAGVISLAFDPADPDTIYAAPWGVGVYRTIDGGETWSKIASLPVSYARNAIVIAGATMFVATDDGVLASVDRGVSWVSTSISSPASAIAVDSTDAARVYAAADHIYASNDAGQTWSALLPVPLHTVATISVTASQVFIGSLLPQNIFITKWSADGHQLLYSTYLGGSSYEYATAIALDRTGNIYVTGFTASPDFPVTDGAVRATLGGTYNAIVVKISADGQQLLYSTYLGGSGHDSARALAIDQGDNVYVTGYTDSPDFPVTHDALQAKLSQTCHGNSKTGDAFISELASRDGALLYSTYLGGSCADLGTAIAVDNNGSIYIAGITSSADFPVTDGAITGRYSGGNNTGFLAKLIRGGRTSAYATFLGTGWGDVAQSLAVDSHNNVYVAGSSFGLEQPGPALGSAAYTVAGFPGQLGTGGPAFVLKLDQAGKKIFATSIGKCMTTATSLAVDGNDNVWLTGSTGIAPQATEAYQNNCIEPTVPTIHPFQALELGWGFIAEISSDGNTVLFSSLADQLTAVSLDPNGNAFAVGHSLNANRTQWASPMLLKINAGVLSLVTLEAPQSAAITLHRWGLFRPAVVAPGALVILTGTGLGPAQQVFGSVTSEQMLTTTVAGTIVRFDGVPAPLISVQSERVVCLAPFELAGNTTSVVQVERAGSLSNAVTIPITPTAVEVLAVVNQDGTPNSPQMPAAPGSILTLYVSGLGAVDPPAPDGAINGGASPAPKATIAVRINSWLPGEIVYYGPAPGQPAGISQINFKIPETIPGFGAWPAGQYSLTVGTPDPSPAGDYDTAQLTIR